MKLYKKSNSIPFKSMIRGNITQAIFFTAFSLTISILFYSCKKLVEVGAPEDRLISGTVFSNNETAISALTGIYARMSNESSLPYNITLLTGLYGDELKNYSTSVGIVPIYTNSLNQLDGTSPNFWQIWYNHIYQANAVLEGCNNSTSLNSNIREQLMAEAKFIRSFWYLYLVNLYGKIPLVTTTDYVTNNVAPKSDESKVYLQIIEDLKAAEAVFKPEYIAGNSTSVTEERVRPNSFAAKALLARAYLYSGNYKEAELKASEVIIQNSLYNFEPLVNTFLKTSKEAIWQLMTPLPSNGTNTLEGLNFILTNRPGTGLTTNSSISSQLLSAFENGDKRKSAWIGEYVYKAVTPNVSYFYVNKYKVKTNNTAITEYTTPLRLAEQHLIRAEARAMINKLPQAVEDVDAIRFRSGLPLIKDTNPSISKEDLLKVIFHERQVELFVEWGHRWIDLKRSGKIDAVMSVVSPTKGGTWSNYKSLWPIPIKDIQNNPNLVQNDGYK